MKLTCDRSELSEAVGLVNQVINARTTRPVLQNLCLRVEGDALEVLGTDLEVGLRVRCERFDAERGGETLLNAAHASAILRELPEDRVELETEDGVTTIRAGGSSFRLVSEDPSSFPQVPSWSDEGAFRVERETLEAMLKKTAFAAATEAVRYALNGVLFEIDGSEETLRLVATDGKRLALCERPLESVGELKVARVVSNKAVQLLMRLGDPGDETLSLSFTGNQLLARSARAVLSAQLVQGQFPPYAEVLPQGLDKRLEFETQPFQAAIRRASLLTTKDSFAVRFAFTYNLLTLTSRLPGVGEGKVELPVAYEHDPLETAFNPQYLGEVLKVLEQPRFVLELKEATLPCVLREGEDFRYVVMPLDLG